jgi:hypothetical protein
VTDNSTDGRPWPIDPIIQPKVAGPLPVPEWGDGAPPGSADDRSNPVTDQDRTVYGDLLDRAAERGLLSEHDYQIRLGELAEATTVNQMQRIVTELPAFVSSPPASAHRPSRRAKPVKVPQPGTVTGRRRSSPWVLLGIVVIVAAVSLVWLSIYADHLIRNHNAGVVSMSVAVSSLGVLRL